MRYRRDNLGGQWQFHHKESKGSWNSFSILRATRHWEKNSWRKITFKIESRGETSIYQTGSSASLCCPFSSRWRDMVLADLFYWRPSKTNSLLYDDSGTTCYGENTALMVYTTVFACCVSLTWQGEVTKCLLVFKSASTVASFCLHRATEHNLEWLWGRGCEVLKAVSHWTFACCGAW